MIGGAHDDDNKHVGEIGRRAVCAQRAQWHISLGQIAQRFLVRVFASLLLLRPSNPKSADGAATLAKYHDLF